MTKYIHAAAAQQYAMERLAKRLPEFKESERAVAVKAAEGVMRDISDMPAADVRENVRAKKIPAGKRGWGCIPWWECEKCGEPVDILDHFCANCGAELEEVEP